MRSNTNFKRDLFKRDPGRISEELGRYRPAGMTSTPSKLIENKASARRGGHQDKPGSMEDSPQGSLSSRGQFRSTSGLSKPLAS